MCHTGHTWKTSFLYGFSYVVSGDQTGRMPCNSGHTWKTSPLCGFSYVVSGNLTGRMPGRTGHTRKASPLYGFSYVVSGDQIFRMPSHTGYTWKISLLCGFSYVLSGFQTQRMPYHTGHTYIVFLRGFVLFCCVSSAISFVSILVQDYGLTVRRFKTKITEEQRKVKANPLLCLVADWNISNQSSIWIELDWGTCMLEYCWSEAGVLRPYGDVKL